MYYSPTTYYRIQRYDSNSSLFGTTVFGETVCGTPPNQFCGCTDIFIDRRNSIYCSDSLNHLVINITPMNPQATIVAGITNSSGSQLNQLNSPQGIFVDSNGTLFVVDSGNNGIGGLTVDSAGSVYVIGSTLQRWSPGTTYLTTIFNSSAWGSYYYYTSQRIAFDNFGNMILRLGSGSGLGLYNILTNAC
ncbi:unnamed protein product [Rotaria sp. Silwood2]|nr:unnamed protein product [Rotaria sp. Silwood2]